MWNMLLQNVHNFGLKRKRRNTKWHYHSSSSPTSAHVQTLLRLGGRGGEEFWEDHIVFRGNGEDISGHQQIIKGGPLEYWLPIRKGIIRELQAFGDQINFMVTQTKPSDRPRRERKEYWLPINCQWGGEGNQKNTAEPYEGISEFYRDTTKILQALPPFPPSWDKS